MRRSGWLCWSVDLESVDAVAVIDELAVLLVVVVVAAAVVADH